MKSKRKKQLGAAAIELALCMPVIFTVIFASIEACNMIALKQIIAESAYDAALVALQAGATEADVIANANTVLAARNITPHQVTIEGPGGISFSSIQHGQPVRVTVEVQTDGNIVGPQLFGATRTVSAESVAMKQ